MRQTSLIIIFTISFLSGQSQEIDLPKFENNTKNWFFLNQVLREYDSIKTIKISKTIDSLKIIDRKLWKEKIKGRWKLVKIICGHCALSKKKPKLPKKTLEINDETLNIYLNDKLKTKEVILFTENFTIFQNDLTEIVFKNNSIWNIRTDSKGNYLALYHSGDELKNGRTVHISGIITEFYKKE